MGQQTKKQGPPGPTRLQLLREVALGALLFVLPGQREPEVDGVESACSKASKARFSSNSSLILLAPQCFWSIACFMLRLTHGSCDTFESTLRIPDHGYTMILFLWGSSSTRCCRVSSRRPVCAHPQSFCRGFLKSQTRVTRVWRGLDVVHCRAVEQLLLAGFNHRIRLRFVRLTS